jgi:DNA-binding NtrC family response regulator
LRNRLLRWKLMGQLPMAAPVGPPRFEAEDLASNLHELERFLLHQALRRSYGNRVEAAQRLGVSRRQLYLLIRRHGDPVRGEAASGDLPQRVKKRLPAQNSSPGRDIR